MNNILEITDKSVLVCGIKVISRETAQGHLPANMQSLPIEITFYQTKLEVKVTNVEVWLDGKWQELPEVACDREELADAITSRLESQNEWYSFAIEREWYESQN